MRFSTISLLPLLVLPFGCKKTDVKTGTPSCITDRINQNSKNSTCKDDDVKKYMFQGKKVYVISIGNCHPDGASEVVSGSCQSLGFLGGMIGNTKINGESFANATYIETVWQNY
jgi:hypothetical protein